MKISAHVENSRHHHAVHVSTDGHVQELGIPGKPAGFGSSVNGGELLFLALATCFCNDLYREADKMNIRITKVSVEASGGFSAAGEPGHHIVYRTQVEGDASDEELAALVRHTDQVAEVQNTLRKGVRVVLLE